MADENKRISVMKENVKRFSLSATPSTYTGRAYKAQRPRKEQDVSERIAAWTLRAT
jgi:hypothetical protein